MLQHMPKDPKTAVDELFPVFQAKFYENLAIALESGAVSEEQMEAEPFHVYRAALRLTSESFVYTGKGYKVLEELRYYI